MAGINLLVANANNNFTQEELNTINTAALDAEKFIANHFTFDYQVDIIITATTSLMPTIPEDGIAGRTYSSRLIMIVLNKAQKPITHATMFETICHEMSHSLRWEKLPEYSQNLFQGIILEGLAVVLEEKAVKEAGVESQFFLEAVTQTSEAEYESLIKELLPPYETKHYDYETIFFTGNKRLPRWVGYRLGYYYVNTNLKQTGRTIEQATLDSYKQFTYK